MRSNINGADTWASSPSISRLAITLTVAFSHIPGVHVAMLLLTSSFCVVPLTESSMDVELAALKEIVVPWSIISDSFTGSLLHVAERFPRSVLPPSYVTVILSKQNCLPDVEGIVIVIDEVALSVDQVYVVGLVIASAKPEPGETEGLVYLLLLVRLKTSLVNFTPSFAAFTSMMLFG